MKLIRLLAIALACALPLALSLVPAGAALAADGHDHDRAREALERGEILPLRTILDRVERESPGQVLEVELERRDGQWIYEVKVLRSGGVLVKLKVAANDGRILDSRQRQHGAPQSPGGRP